MSLSDIAKKSHSGVFRGNAKMPHIFFGFAGIRRLRSGLLCHAKRAALAKPSLSLPIPSDRPPTRGPDETILAEVCGAARNDDAKADARLFQ